MANPEMEPTRPFVCARMSPRRGSFGSFDRLTNRRKRLIDSAGQSKEVFRGFGQNSRSRKRSAGLWEECELSRTMRSCP